MKYLIFILSFTTVLSATQPIWDVVCKSLVGTCSTSGLCEGPTCGQEEEEKGSCENPNRQCCPSFQCCYIAFGGFSTPYLLDFKELSPLTTHPAGRVLALRSTFISDCFHPPNLAFSIV